MSNPEGSITTWNYISSEKDIRCSKPQNLPSTRQLPENVFWNTMKLPKMRKPWYPEK
jgi:hypothetical protein